MKRVILTALFLAGALGIGLAQSDYHLGVFPTFDHSGIVSNRLDYSLYYFGAINLHNSEIAGKRETAKPFIFYAEHALTYKATPALSFTGAYVYERVRPTEDNYRNENRFYLQGSYRYNLGRTALLHRLRYDGRFIQDRATDTYPFSSRLRYLFGGSVPLHKSGSGLYFAAYNEFFFNLQKSAIAIYGENWMYAGIGKSVGKHHKLEAGPLYIASVANRNNDLSNLIYLQLTWTSHFDFRKTTTAP